MNEYAMRAKEFLKKIGATVKIVYLNTGPVPDWGDNYDRNSYRVVVLRNGKQWSYVFHDSVHNTIKNIKPTEYDVLSCVQKWDPGTIDDFVDEFGYEVHKWSDVRKIEKIYKAVKKEAANFQRLFGDVSDEMGEVFA